MNYLGSVQAGDSSLILTNWPGSASGGASAARGRADWTCLETEVKTCTRLCKYWEIFISPLQESCRVVATKGLPYIISKGDSPNFPEGKALILATVIGNTFGHGSWVS